MAICAGYPFRIQRPLSLRHRCDHDGDVDSSVEDPVLMLPAIPLALEREEDECQLTAEAAHAWWAAVRSPRWKSAFTLRRKKRRHTVLVPLQDRPPSRENRQAPPSPQHPNHLPLRSSSRQVSPRIQLQPLEVQTLERKRVFLDPNGGPATVGVEQILRFQELQSPSKPRSSPLQLAMIPKKCVLADEMALMPCHRVLSLLGSESWKEPIRDRDKIWARDELSIVLALSRMTGSRSYRMTNLSKHCLGKWTHWEAQKLHIHGAAGEAETPSLPGQVLLRNQGAMVSSTYCILSVYGVGIYGRLYGAGLHERHGMHRFLRIEAYDPGSSQRFTLIVTLGDLEELFEQRTELLVAGKKQAIIKQLVALLFFEYDGQIDDNELQVAPTLSPFQDLILDDRRPLIPTKLCISAVERLNAAAQRRLEREERLRREEQERLRALAQFMKLPRRARYRLLCRLMHIQGHRFIISIYHLPTQVRNFVVLAYHPSTSRTLSLAIGVMEAAAIARIFTLQHKWTSEQKLQIAQSLLPRLRLCGCRLKVTPLTIETDAKTSTIEHYANHGMALAVTADRMGVLSEWLPLEPGFRTPEMLHEELLRKQQKDAHRVLETVLKSQLKSLQTDHKQHETALLRQTQDAEIQIKAIDVRDAELKEQIEEINSGKGVVTVTSSAPDDDKRHHELRRAHKATRKTLKEQKKALQTQISRWKHELQMTLESERIETAKAQLKYERAAKTLAEQAEQFVMGVCDDVDRNRKTRNRRVPHAWLHRSHIQDPETRFLVSGACRIREKRYRYSLFAVDRSSEHSDQPVQTSIDRFRLQFYDAKTSSIACLELSRLDWIALTKQTHDAQQQIPQLSIENAVATQRVAELDVAFTTMCGEYMELTKATSANQQRKKSYRKKREALWRDLEINRLERKRLHEIAPWTTVVQELCDRLTISSAAVDLDRCIFRTIAPIVSIADDTEDEGKPNVGPAEDDVVFCHVRASQTEQEIQFDLYDPLSGHQWTITYSESVELVKEFAIETFVEQQMHLEAIAMTLLLFRDPQDPERLAVRFEE